MSILITLAIFLGSLAGIIAIMYRKIPLLLELSSKGDIGIGEFVKKGAQNVAVPEKLKSIAATKILQKALLKTRQLAIKTENQTGRWLENLRQSSQERKSKFTESYWEQFKKKRTKEK